MSHYQGSVPDTEPAPDWLALAPCRAYADTMFDTSPASIETAKSICGRCTVVDQCRQWALDNREAFGTWGGLSERERARILRRRGIRLAGPVEEEEPRPRTFQSLYAERTVALADGHLAWTGAVPIHCDGAYHTPTQIAFRVDRGRPAIGVVRRTCARDGCVLPAHLRDRQEREQARLAAAS